VNAGIFASDDQMYDRFAQANKEAGEKMWRLPLDDEYKEIIKSNIADIVNSGGRWGGAISAAMFLKEFAEDTPWITSTSPARPGWRRCEAVDLKVSGSGAGLIEFVRGWAPERTRATAGLSSQSEPLVSLAPCGRCLPSSHLSL
jgi:hypothetical protein